MNCKKFFCLFLAFAVLIPVFSVTAFANDDTAVFNVDSLNGTRWADYLCVYRDVPTTGQNEWGENVVVNSEGIVTEKIPGADVRGKNLAVPEGGFVVSGTGDIGKAMYDSAEIGDRCLFDEYGMRVYFSKGEIDPFYVRELRVTGYNDVRWSNTVIVYNKSGERTGTNPYGYEVCVGADGYVIVAGGNDNSVPDGGYVISATEQEDINTLKHYFIVGAKCVLEKESVTVTYSKNELAMTARRELALLNSALEEARSQYRLIDYAAIESAINGIDTENISTLEERNEVIAEIRAVEPRLVESRTVDTRSVWYTPVEDDAGEVKATVAEMKAAGINELILSSNSYNGTFIPIDTDVIPFKRDAVVRKIDLLQTYIDECRANGISIVVLVPVMGGSFAEKHTEWFDVTNTGELRDEIFFSPANEEYRKAYMDYIRYIITNYDVDGLQLDYIRYPQFYNNVDAGYDDASIKLFEEKTGLGEDVVREIGKQLTAHPQWDTWIEFKTGLINSWVEEIYGIASELRPDIFVSAAVAANNTLETYCQDSSAWVKGGYIDGIYVMSYTEEINEHTVGKFEPVRGDNSYLVMGCGAYLSISDRSLAQQTSNSIEYGADGTAYFEWGAVRDHGYIEMFNSSLFATEAVPFTSDADEVVKRLVKTAKERVALYCETADEAKATELGAIMDKLPAEAADKDALTEAIDGLSAALDGADEGYLTADLKAALRAVNIEKEEYEFVKPAPDDSSADISEDISAVSENSGSDTDDGESEGTDMIWIYITVAVVLVIAIAAVIIKKKK